MFEAAARSVRGPQRDDKILTAWNGLMIAAFARMARVLRGLGDDGRTGGEPYLEAARRAALFMRERMWNAEYAACCCAAIATGTPRSTATPKTTRT